ncbi:hypothetical protein ACH5RR_014742 [Cinchona calisaya]|uniref:RING-type domain-containing protein n=1 Tax=Cinchona calisaya TaxID=153742 RepID=A0ABD2ZRK3_9GENT
MLGFGLQGRLERERGATITLVEFLREKMNGSDRMVRRKSLSERLGLKGFGCCGAKWGLGANNNTNNMRVRDDEDEEEGGPHEPEIEVIDVSQTSPENGSTPSECSGEIPSSSSGGMNLAAALAAERHFRAAQELDGVAVGLNLISPSPITRPNTNDGLVNDHVTGTPLRVSLMRLLEETDDCDHGDMEKDGEKGVGSDSMCCVCMGRKKGAAFIPCGHTFCRMCSRELWLNRGFCPLCNRSILEILDIF